MNKKSELERFYENATILITGGTGFLGKILIEKFLRDFNVKKIILLIRVKDNLSVNERLELFFQESVFNRLREENPSAFSKVISIKSNFESYNLDISEEELKMIHEEVEIVFNVVASVKFNQKFKDALNINVLGTKKILNIILNIKNLKSFLHISTLYSNCNLKYIEEKIYQSSIEFDKIIHISRYLTEEDLDKLSHCLVGDMPNTYTMTKQCAENLVNFKAYNLPAGIFRPPIVISTYKEPVPGWTDNLNGPAGTCTWSAKGVIRCILGNKDRKANLIPVDYCINAIIAAGWDVNLRFFERQLNYDVIPVYNYTFAENNLTWGQYMRKAKEGFHEPFDKTAWCFSYTIISSRIIFNIYEFFVHTIPGYIFDMIALATCQQNIYTKGYRKIHRIIRLLSYFGLKEWTFQNDNTLKLSEFIKSKNLNNKNFNLEFDVKTINWNEYFRYYLFGIKKYFFKENFDKSEILRKRYRRYCIAHSMIKFLFWILCSTIPLSYIWKILMGKRTKLIEIL